MKYSFVIPVYNRPQELRELLSSLACMSCKDFEVIVVEDGSSISSEDVCNSFAEALTLRYFSKPNSGPGLSRNYGAERATGEYIIVLDSDCVVPPDYLTAVEAELQCAAARSVTIDAFGGSDRASDDFTPIQKAISYSMTSFWTTGGIRGGKHKMDKFYPRSFNMGVRRGVWNKMGGFSPMRFGEDIDFSIRLYKDNCQVRLFPEAWVWHKRRTNFRQFYKQVFNSGVARINLYKKYPESLKLVHTLPALFTVGCTACLLLMLWHWWFILPVVLYCLLLFCSAWITCKSLKVAGLAVVAAFVQLFGYGLGFLQAYLRRVLGRRSEYASFQKNFYE